jgi:hypothetical protein
MAVLISSSSAATTSLAIGTDSTFGGPVAVPTVLLDQADGLLLSVDLSADAANPGAYVLTVPGSGEYHGTATLSGPSSNIHLDESSAAQFYSDSAAAPTDVAIEVHGHIVPDTGVVGGEANIQFDVVCIGASPKQGCPSFHFKSKVASAGDAKHVADAVATALVAKDWGALFALETTDLTSTITRDQFAHNMSAQAGQIRSVTSAGDETLTTTLGHIYFDRPVTVLAVKGDGSSVKFDSHIGLVLELGGWRYYGSDSPPGS